MFLTGKRILLAKEEATYGLDPTPTVGSNAIDAEKISLSYEGDVLERNPVRGYLSPVEPAGIGKRSVKLSFDVEIKGSGSVGTAAKIGDLLEACGFAETVSAGSAVSYAPASGAVKSVTMYLYDLQDSGSCVLHKIKGARGTFQLNAAAGQIAKLSFTFNGLYELPTDAAAPSAPTYGSTKPAVVESAQLTLNGVTSLVVQEVSVDVQNNIVAADDVNAATGISKFALTGRKPTGKITPEAVLLATYDFWTDWVNATARAASMVIGATAGNIVTISMPKLNIDSVSLGDKSGILTRELPFRAAANAGNDELSFIFT